MSAAVPVALTVAAVALPLAVALLCLFATGRGAALAVAPWAAAPALAVALVAPDGVVIDLPWALLGVQMGLQPIARLFLLFTALLWLAGGHFAQGYLRADARRVRFTAFFTLTLAGNIGLILALDLATFYLFFALMTFAAYGLVIHAASAEALRAGRVYIAMAVIGEAFLIAGLIAAADAAGGVRIADIPAGVAASPARDAIMASLLLGFGVKAGLLGVHMWLPLAHPVAPTPASAVLSGAMIKAGLLGWLLVLPLGQAPQWAVTLTALGLAAAFFGVAAGVLQREPKAMLAYSSISQMGLMLAALAIGAGAAGAIDGAAVAAFYAAHHGLAKAALFLGVGVVAATARGSRARTAALIVLAVPALALVGAPWTSGAAAKGLLETQLAGQASLAWAKPWLTAAAVGTGALMIRLLLALASSESSAGERLGVRPVAAWLALSVASALAAWWLLMPWALPVPLPTKPAAPLGALLPLGVALLLALAWSLFHRSARWSAPHIPPGDVIALMDAGPAHRALLGTVELAAHVSNRVWAWAVRTERRARRRLLVEIGREEFAFPIAAGAVVLIALSALLIVSV
jgi:formate hydrogenlyase subunit 3/multisubunit Na+/H+ antiporter MnhD subunit